MLSKTLWTPTVEFQVPLPPYGAEFGDSHGTGAITELSLLVEPLLAGLHIRATCGETTWKQGLGADVIKVLFAPTSNPSASGTAEIYSVESGQNMTLQKTLFDLEPYTEYFVRLLLCNSAGKVLFATPSTSVFTLSLSQPLA